MSQARLADFVLECEGLIDPESAKFRTLVGAERSPLRAPEAPAERIPVAKRPGGNPFTNMITIGRAANNDIVLPESSVSKFHAFLRPSDEGLLLVDANSRNGSFVNGVRLDPQRAQRLEVGDAIRLGNLNLRLLNTPPE